MQEESPRYRVAEEQMEGGGKGTEKGGRGQRRVDRETERHTPINRETDQHTHRQRDRQTNAHRQGDR